MIHATIPAERPPAHDDEYKRLCDGFSWSAVEAEFSWSRTGRLNIVHEAVDRWADAPTTRDRTAMIFEKGGRVQTFSYRELKRISCRWANMFARCGFKTGDCLFIYLTPCPEIYFAILACARLGVLFSPLFSTLTFDELEERLENSKPRGVLTHPDLAERLPDEAMSHVTHTFLTQGPLPERFPGEIDVQGLPDRMPDHLEPAWVTGDAPLYLLYTSGSTGPPKGVVHAHHDMVGHLITARYVFGLTPDAVIWTDADPSWVTGTVYGVFAPWLCGATSVVQGDPFSASTWYRTLEIHSVAVWYITPGVLRKLSEAGEDLTGRYDFSALRHVNVVGEALVPELIYWFRKNFNLTPHDSWWMTETGMICIANFPFMDVKPGAMGKPVPGVTAAVIDEKGNPLPAMTMGELALKPPWPAMMTEILKDKKRYKEYFKLKGWFLTGDMAVRDEDGYIYHQGRTDDLIKAGVKLIGPYEIERALGRHPAVQEAAVISRGGRPGEPALKAFITVHKGVTPSGRLNQDIKAFVKAGLSHEVSLSEVVFLDEIPKTRSGKLLRRALRARELGVPIGDPKKINDG